MMIFTKFVFNSRFIQSSFLCRIQPKFFCSAVTPPPKEGFQHKQEKPPEEKTIKECETKAEVSKKGLVVGVYEDGQKFELTPTAEEVDQKSGGKLSKHLSELSKELKLGKAFVVTDLLPEYSGVAIASFGQKDAGYSKLEELDQARENIRWGVGAGVMSLQERGCTLVSVDGANAPDAAAEAATLAAWRFQEFKSSEDRVPDTVVSLYGQDDADKWHTGHIYARAQNWARFMSDMPANNMTPVDLSQEALNVLCPLGVKVEAHDRSWITAQNMQAFLTVARGSCETPMFLECHYYGAKDSKPPVLIVAKGVTFDSGGLCLKHGRAMADNRGSMAGAAVALAALRVLAELKIPLNVHVCIPLCENMISGQCMKVGDVVRALNGLSIQIEDTDMEGRLMMADALVYGQANYQPSLVFDVATLTRGVLLATGGGAFGCFSNSTSTWQLMQRAGAVSGDRPWRFPLWGYYQKLITDDPSVDLRNKGSGKATPCIGAAFLRNFIRTEWLHLDITGVGKLAHCVCPYLQPRRMTGRPARTLALALQHLASDRRAPDKAQDKLHCNWYVSTFNFVLFPPCSQSHLRNVFLKK